jgi:hypothetical protein
MDIRATVMQLRKDEPALSSREVVLRVQEKFGVTINHSYVTRTWRGKTKEDGSRDGPCTNLSMESEALAIREMQQLSTKFGLSGKQISEFLQGAYKAEHPDAPPDKVPKFGKNYRYFPRFHQPASSLPTIAVLQTTDGA